MALSRDCCHGCEGQSISSKQFLCEQNQGDRVLLSNLVSMVLQGALEILYHGNNQEARKEYEAKFANPYRSAELGHVDDVIRPRETRSRLCTELHALKRKVYPTKISIIGNQLISFHCRNDFQVLNNPPKKHSNCPL